MRCVLPFLVLIVTMTNLYALQPQVKQKPAQPQQPATGGQQAETSSPEAAVKPSSSFTPSEKVQADSAVSFPVDI